MIRGKVDAVAVVALLALGLAAGGCGESAVGNNPPELAKVSGKITVGGRAYEGVTVIFTPVEGGGESMAQTDKEGKYELEYGGGGMKGAVIGKHRVGFRHNEEDVVNGAIIPGGESVLPEKYFEGNSQITREVQTGEQTIDFELDGKR